MKTETSNRKAYKKPAIQVILMLENKELLKQTSYHYMSNNASLTYLYCRQRRQQGGCERHHRHRGHHRHKVIEPGARLCTTERVFFLRSKGD